MNKIKSEAAKDYLLNQSAHRDSKEGRNMGIVCTYVDATKAVLIAEQDAEERYEKRIFETQKLFVEVMKQKFGYINALEVSAEVSKMIINKLNSCTEDSGE